MDNNQANQINVTEAGASGDLRMNQQNYTDLYNALQNNLQSAVQTQLQSIGQSAVNKGAMLGTPTPTMGISSYDYNRLVGPAHQANMANLNLTGVQLGTQQALKNMLADAQYNLQQAAKAYNARRYARAVASAGAGNGGSGGGTGGAGGDGATITGVETNASVSSTPDNSGVAGGKVFLFDANGNIIGWSTPSTGPDGQPGVGRVYGDAALRKAGLGGPLTQQQKKAQAEAWKKANPYKELPSWLK